MPTPTTTEPITPQTTTPQAAAEPQGEAGGQPAEPTTQPHPTPDPEHLVPVSEAIRYRRRAQAAEHDLEQLQSQLQAAREELAQSRDTVTALERRAKIDELLREADAADLGVARLLTETLVTQHDTDHPDADPDDQALAAAVHRLRRDKPYLFHRRPARAAMAPAQAIHPDTDADHAAQQAATTGDRRDLLHYLRLRRRA